MGRPGTRGWSQAGLKKIRKEKTRRDPATWLTFVFFFTKMTLFRFKKKIDPDNLVTRSKFGELVKTRDRALD
jgi:hypothetical protein